jgi:Sulfotransferase family
MNIQSKASLHGVESLQAYYTPQEVKLGRERFRNETLTIISEAHRSRQTMPIFTFVRDPVARFLSGVGQALRLNQLGTCTRNGPWKDSVKLLECVLTQIQSEKQFLDEHLEPQIIELYNGIKGLDLHVHVMDLKSMDAVLQIVGLPRRAVSKRHTNGLVAGYNLSLYTLTPKLIQRICFVYRMDALFLHSLLLEFTIPGQK